MKYILLIAFLSCAHLEKSSDIKLRYVDKKTGHCPGRELITSEFELEARKKEKYFQDLWQREGQGLVDLLRDDFDKDFVDKAVYANLTLCNLRSQAFKNPVIINIKKHIKHSLNKGDAPKDIFVNLVFHELTHLWLLQNYSGMTPTMEKYQHLGDTVVYHLHLMALQKYIYAKGNRLKLVKHLDYIYNIFGGDYLVAWQLVNSGQNYTNLLLELRSQKYFLRKAQ